MLKNYIERLKNTLNDNFYVTDEEQISYPEGKHVCIVKNYNSVNFKSCIQFGLQLQFLTNNVREIMNYLSVWSWEQNENKYSLNNFPYVRQLVSQPINNSNFVQMRSEYIGTIIVTVTLLASFNLTDFKEVYIDNELIDPNTLTINYTATPNNNRKNDEELNTTLINESNLQLQITIPNDNTNFMKKATSIMFGKLSKNTDFVLKLIDTNDQEIEMIFKMSNSSTQMQRGALTTTTITLMH